MLTSFLGLGTLSQSIASEICKLSRCDSFKFLDIAQILLGHWNLEDVNLKL